MRFLRSGMFLIACLCSAGAPLIAADSWSIVITTPDKDIAFNALQNRNGDFFITGQREGGGFHPLLIRLRSDGSLVFQKEYSGISFPRIFRTFDDGIIGASLRTATRFDKDGDVAWAQVFGTDTSNNFFVRIGSIRQTRDRGFVVVGQKLSRDPGIWIAKLNRLGTMVWQKAYAACDRLFQDAKDVLTSPDGSFLIGGTTSCSSLTNGFDLQVIVVKFTSDGKVAWRKEFGTTEDDQFIGIEKASGGSVVLGQTTQGSFLIKLDAKGNQQWFQSYPFLGGRDIRSTRDGGFILVTTDALLKLNSLGIVQWRKRYQFAEYSEFFSVLPASDGGYLLTGRARIANTGARRDLWILKVDENGDISNGCVSVHSEPISQITLPVVMLRAKKLRRVPVSHLALPHMGQESALSSTINRCE